MKSKIHLLALSLFLVACSNDEPATEPQTGLGDVSAYTSEQLQKLVEDREHGKAARIINERAKLRIATVDDFLLMADIFNARLDGESATLALDQANTMGATREKMALPLTRAYMLQQRFNEAKEEIRLAPLTRFNGVEINILEGQIAQALGNMDTARRYFGLARDIEPGNYKVDTALALLEMTAGNFEVAKELARAAIEKNPTGGDAKPYFALGAIDRLQGNSAAAIPHLQKALVENSDDMLSQLELIGAYLDTDQTEKAETVLDGLIAVSPGNMLGQFYVAYILASKGKNVEAEDVLLRARDLLASYRPAKRLYGHVSYNLGNLDTAANYLGQYLSVAPDDTETRLALADTHTRSQRPQEALKVLELVLKTAAISLETDQNGTTSPIQASGPMVEALARAAAAYQSAGNISAARQNYEKAITLAENLDPADPVLVSSLTAVLASMEFGVGERDKGLALMTTATAADTATQQQLLTLANMQMMNNQLDAALTTAERLQADPESINVANNLMGAIEFRRSNYQASITALTQALTSNPNYASARKNRARSYMALSQFNEALDDLLVLKSQADGDGEYFGMLGRSYLELNNYVAAIDAYQTALKIIPNSPLFTANYASALGEKQRYAEAITHAKTALMLAPDDKNFQEQVGQMLQRFEAAAVQQARSGN